MILTGGGFHHEWFRQVVTLGYNYIGRIRVGISKQYWKEATKGWVYCAYLMKTASPHPAPRSLGEVNLCKHRPIKTHLFLFKGKSKERTDLNRLGKKRRGGIDLEYRRTAKEPWLLSSLLTGNYLMAKWVVKKYAYRMQIEEGFRDLKSSQYGFCFENAYSKQPARVEVLLLIAMFASFIAWVIGWIGEQTGLHVQFQSNTPKQPVLSLFYLGCQMIRRKIKINLTQWNTAHY